MTFILQVLATYAVVYTLVNKDGPYGVLYKLRKNQALGALQCITCTSWWIAPFIGLYGAANGLEWALTSLALVGTTIIIDHMTTRLLV